MSCFANERNALSNLPRLLRAELICVNEHHGRMTYRELCRINRHLESENAGRIGETAAQRFLTSQIIVRIVSRIKTAPAA
jgi:hypothetical protein